MIPPEKQVAEERKTPNPARNRNPQENALGYQIQKETLHAPLYVIPPNEQVVKERKPSINRIPKGPFKDKPNKNFPKVVLMEKSYAQGTKSQKKTTKIEPS